MNRTPDENRTWPGLVLRRALQVGGLAGASGLIFGAITGVIRSTSPTLFALASGIQWFGLASTFWGIRSTLVHARYLDAPTPREKLVASGVAGGGAGGVVGLLSRGRANAIPGAIMFSIFGAGGQGILNMVDDRRSRRLVEDAEDPSRQQTATHYRWSPVKVLSDEEYLAILQEKQLRLDAEVVIIDDEIQRLQSNK